MALTTRERTKLAAQAARYVKRIQDCRANARSVATKLAEDPTSAKADQWRQRLAELDAQVKGYEAHLAMLDVQGVTVPREGDHAISPQAGSMGVTGSEA